MNRYERFLRANPTKKLARPPAGTRIKGKDLVVGDRYVMCGQSRDDEIWEVCRRGLSQANHDEVAWSRSSLKRFSAMPDGLFFTTNESEVQLV